MRVRFAPSPTGQLHVGNARTALFNWLLARHAGGTFVLRIEDTDIERSSAEAAAQIVEDLRWLGLDWDEGPDIGGPHAPYRQSDRLALYREHAHRLLAAGSAYYCFCSADELEADRRAAVAAGRPAIYSGRCRVLGGEAARRRIAVGEPAAVRFRVPPLVDVSFLDAVRGRVTFRREVIGDPVILRSDGRAAYNFAVVVDDALMGITHVVRGEDHISNTPRQLLFYQALGYEPPLFAHLALVLGPDHTPLSKRHGATSVGEFRARGYLPEALVNYLALLGWSPGHDEEVLPPAELVRRFSLEDVGKSAGVFDEAKLAWVNRRYFRDAAPERLADLALPYFQQLGLVAQPAASARAFLAQAASVAAASVDRLADFPGRVRFLWRYDPVAALSEPDIAAEFADPAAREVASLLAERLAGEPRLDRGRFRAAAAAVRQQTGRKARALFHPIRIVLTGQAAGPELDLAVPLIEAGCELPADAGVQPILGCRERAALFVETLNRKF